MSRWKPLKQKPAGQMSVFDLAERKKQDGINLSYSHADSVWKEVVRDVLREICNSKPEFTTDEIWDKLAARGIHTGEPRALGAIIQGAHRSGMIKPTGNYAQSYRRHKAPIILWQSLIYKPEQRA